MVFKTKLFRFQVPPVKVHKSLRPVLFDFLKYLLTFFWEPIECGNQSSEMYQKKKRQPSAVKATFHIWFSGTGFWFELFIIKILLIGGRETSLKSGDWLFQLYLFAFFHHMIDGFLFFLLLLPLCVCVCVFFYLYCSFLVRFISGRKGNCSVRRMEPLFGHTRRKNETDWTLMMYSVSWINWCQNRCDWVPEASIDVVGWVVFIICTWNWPLEPGTWDRTESNLFGSFYGRNINARGFPY